MSNCIPTPIYHIESEHVYEPREDTFLLIDALEADLPLLNSIRPVSALEIGPGSGVVITSLAVALGQTLNVCLAIDINPFACTTTKTTAASNHAKVEIVNGDLVDCLQLKNIVDLLIFNPPYLPSDDGEDKELIDKAWAGSHQGRSTTDRLFPLLPRLMSSRSLGYIVVVEENRPLEMVQLLKKLGFSSKFVKERNVRGERLKILRFSRGLLCDETS